MNRIITAIFLMLVIASIWVGDLKDWLFLYAVGMLGGAAISVYCRMFSDENASLKISAVKYIFKITYLVLVVKYSTIKSGL